MTYASKQSTESTSSIVLSGVQLDLSSFCLSRSACFFKFLRSFCAQSIGLVLRIADSGPSRIELCASLKRGPLGSNLTISDLGSGWTTSERDSGMEDILKSVLGREKERHFGSF